MQKIYIKLDPKISDKIKEMIKWNDYFHLFYQSIIIISHVLEQ